MRRGRDEPAGALAGAFRWSILSQYGSEAVSFVSVVVLARLLSPTEIGTFSVALAAVLMAHELREFGTPQYVIQAESLAPDRLRAALGVTCIMAWSVGAVLALAGPWLAEFYGEPGLRTVMLVMACNLVIIPLNGLTEACLQREMAFGTLLRINLVTSCTYAAVVIALALLGLGYMSMAWATLVATLVSILMLNIHRPAWCPVWPCFRGLGEIWSFGTFASAAALARKFAEVLPELVVAKGLGLHAAGYYSRGLGLVMLFNRAVTLAIRPVILPHFSAEERARSGIAEAYLRTISHLTCLAWPFFAVLSLLAFPAMRILYGDQWDDAVPVARALCLWAGLEAVFAFSSEAMIAVGMVRRVLLKEGLVLPARAFGLVLAVAHELVTVAFALAAVAVLELVLTLWLLQGAIGLSPRALWHGVRGNVLVTVLAAAGPATVCALWNPGPGNVWGPALLSVPLALGGWVLGVLLTGHELSRSVARLLGR